MQLEKLFSEPLQNIAELLDEKQLATIYNQVSQKYRDDLAAMGQKIDKLRDAVKLASLISERNVPFLGASNVVFPLAAMSCIQYGATAYQALFPDDDIAKVKIVGKDNGKPAKNGKGEILTNEDGSPQMQFVGEKQKIGERLTTTINYQLTDELEYWKPEAISAMFRLPALGTMFKKTCWNFILDRLDSHFIDPDRIIIHPGVKRIENNVWSEVFELDKKTIETNIKAGLWLEYDVEKSGNQTTQTQPPKIKEEEQNRRTDVFQFVEQHTFLDLDEDGIDEPYCVVFDTGSMMVVRITPDFDLENIKKNADGKPYFIERNECLTYFGFLPDFAGGFYSIGFAELLMNNNAAINTSINQMIDAGNMKLKGGGFISTGAGLGAGAITFKLGEYKKVNTAGGNLANNIFPMPFPEPSPVLFSLLGLMIESGKEIGSLRDVITGDTAANMAPTTFMGIVEQGMKVQNSIIKNNHESFKKELKIVRRLNSKYLSRFKYADIIDVDEPLQVDPAIDFSAKKVDLVLVTDTSAITSAQKFAQAQLLMSLMDNPYYNKLELCKMFNEAIQMPKLNEIVQTPPPTPDANLIFAQAEDKKAQVKYLEAQTKAQETQAKIGKMIDDLQLMATDIKLKESEIVKNIAEAIATEKETSIKQLVAFEKALTDRVNSTISARDIEIQRELAIKATENEPAKESASGMAA